jgi:hypothetical protein
MKKTFAWILLVIVAGVIGYYIQPKPQAQVTTQDQVAVTPTPASTSSPQATPTFLWTFPDGKVTLTANGKNYAAGTFQGNCSVVGNTSWPLLANEVTGVICYFAGGGDEVGVFKENGGYVLKQGVVEEGDAETPGFRGQFKVIQKL